MPTTRRPHLLLAALLAAGCAAPLPPAASPGAGERTTGPRTGGTASTAPAATASPAGGGAIVPATAKPSAQPSAAATPAAPVIALPTAAPVPVASAIAPPTITAPAQTPVPGGPTNKFGIPKNVAIAIPTGLQALTGVKLIGMDGSTMVAAGAGNYRLQNAAWGQGAAFLLGINTFAVLHPLAIVNAVLLAIAPLNLQPDMPLTFDDDERPGQKNTIVLRVAADHARIEAFHAATVDPARQYLGMRFTDAAHGTVVLRSMPDDPGDLNGISETWDFETGQIVADGAFLDVKNDEGVRQRTNGHWEMGAAPDAAGAVFGLRATMTIRKGEASTDSESLGFAANFGASGGGAHWIKARTKDTAGQAVLFPADGLSWLQDPPAPFGFYVGADGKNQPAEGAPEALKAILPVADAALPAYPPDPDAVEMFADPRLAFPK